MQIECCNKCPLCAMDWEMGFVSYQCQHPTDPAKTVNYNDSSPDHGHPLEDKVADDCPLRQSPLVLEVKP